MSKEQDEMVTRLAEMLDLARLLGIEPDSKTLAKILVLQELLKKGYSVRRALASVGLGWKIYYKHTPLIYNDPGLLVPDLEGLRIALNEVAYIALGIVLRDIVNRKIKRSNVRREWLQIARDPIVV